MRGTDEMEAEVEFDEGEEPSFSDPEDFVDDISDEGRSLFSQETTGFIRCRPVITHEL